MKLILTLPLRASWNFRFLFQKIPKKVKLKNGGHVKNNQEIWHSIKLIFWWCKYFVISRFKLLCILRQTCISRINYMKLKWKISLSMVTYNFIRILYYNFIRFLLITKKEMIQYLNVISIRWHSSAEWKPCLLRDDIRYIDIFNHRYDLYCIPQL